MSRHSVSGRAAQSDRARCFATYGTTCWLGYLGCTGTATQVDHVMPASIRPDLRREPSNHRPVCASCNMRRGTKPPAVARRRAQRLVKRRLPRW
jgi:5-methylcytosine-specific restriction endonuclease McrA